MTAHWGSFAAGIAVGAFGLLALQMIAASWLALRASRRHRVLIFRRVPPPPGPAEDRDLLPHLPDHRRSQSRD